jgi:hypothetical protein
VPRGATYTVHDHPAPGSHHHTSPAVASLPSMHCSRSQQLFNSPAGHRVPTSAPRPQRLRPPCAVGDFFKDLFDFNSWAPKSTKIWRLQQYQPPPEAGTASDAGLLQWGYWKGSYCALGRGGVRHLVSMWARGGAVSVAAGSCFRPLLISHCFQCQCSCSHLDERDTSRLPTPTPISLARSCPHTYAQWLAFLRCLRWASRLAGTHQ